MIPPPRWLLVAAAIGLSTGCADRENPDNSPAPSDPGGNAGTGTGGNAGTGTGGAAGNAGTGTGGAAGSHERVLVPIAPPIAEACGALFSAYRGWRLGCQGAAPSLEALGPLVDRCGRRASLPGLQITPDLIQSCASKVSAAGCAALPLECLVRPEVPYRLESLPLDVIWLGPEDDYAYELSPRTTGVLAPGSACEIDAQCATGTCAATAGECGFCAELQAAGQPCGGLEVCAPSAACQGGVCVEKGDPIGAPCKSVKGSSSCQAGTYCQQGASFGSGICQPMAALGEACTGFLDGGAPCLPPDLACVAGQCAAVVTVGEGESCDDFARYCTEGLFCMGPTPPERRCRAPVTGRKVGEACNPDACDAPLVCDDHRCSTSSTPGDPCYEVCGGGLVCLGEVCAAPFEAGDSCGLGRCAAGLICRDDLPLPQICAPPSGEGEPCNWQLPCLPSLTCRSGLCTAAPACP
jgi:hypothetical protein